MLRRFASALLVLLLLGAAVAGAATRRRGHECRMPAGHDCCKRARSDGHMKNSDGHLQNDVAPPPCCLVDSPQPAPAGTNFTLRPPSDAGPAPQSPAAQTPGLHASTRARASAQPFQPSHSPPAYIQHLALLI